MSRPGELVQPVPDAADKAVQCVACAHMCRIRDGGHGVCHVRFNSGGTLRVPHGYASSVACDPIEKKPFYHFLPGRDALSFGMLGCNLHCPFCQNWTISQALRDPEAVLSPRPCSAEQLVSLARRNAAPILSSTYNEPLISSEWAVEIFRLGKAHGLLTTYVSNGFASPQVLEYLDPWLDAMNVDLKCFSDEGYRTLGGRLDPVLDTIRALWARRKWVEVITLIVPGFNDSDRELAQIAEFLVSVSPDIPWHVTAYHADYKMAQGPARTSMERLQAGAEIGRKAGLRYIYGGNLLGLGRHENTYCHSCGRLLIERRGFSVSRNEVEAGGVCPGCQARVPGVWQVPECTVARMRQ
ncbi:MAG: AmmeMemoRadiSam system radical SAM enzyme [Lentisphaerae bacterium RIFOXYB12_FULL_65_16]|nr:MAG: AmmeMemoRadiSam system radical SAM enzyme [Lentisphaerae bacterium RIFOXYA12_64_32]OGV89082.1 MAG: AmmeMemoRadiSam system radical SAM enzyme [Lentisphaerae bacterium RIFOXYB12_FULL_65_16]